MEQKCIVEPGGENIQNDLEPESVLMARRQRYRLLERLIVEGSDALVCQVCCRLEADRARKIDVMCAETLTWAEIAEWAERERLLSAERCSCSNALRRPYHAGLGRVCRRGFHPDEEGEQ